MLFQWTRLGLNQFRLLERRTPLPNGTPSFVLKTFSIASSSSTPPYAALLYIQTPKDTKSSTTESVILNGRSFTVPANAFEALKKVEERNGEGYEFLWIDCLCVNLKDERERTGLDDTMGRIFEGADTVVAWMRDDLPEGLAGLCTSREEPVSETVGSSEFASFRQAFARLGSLPKNESLWSSSGIYTKSKVVLNAGNAHLNDEAVRGIFKSNEQQSSASPSL